MAKFNPNYDAFETITVSTSAIGFTAATFGKERTRALVTVEDAGVRYRVDGTDPSPTVGHHLDPGDTLDLDSFMQLKKARFVRRDGADATLSCSYGR